MRGKLPNKLLIIKGRKHTARGIQRCNGRGMGSVLLNVGGAGAGSSYPSVSEYERITGNQIKGSGLNDKLSKLIVKPLKHKPIHFQM
jgi:hypothetical protein